MDSNKYKIPNIIIQSLFSSDNVKKGIKELENYIMNNFPDKNELNLMLQTYKSDLFDLNENFKNSIIHGDITPIMAMQEIIQKYDVEPESYFILFKPLFELYKTNLDSKHIINFTNKITNFLSNKPKVVLLNFNDFFEVLILLKINQEQEVKNAGNALDKLLKESLQKYSHDMESYDKYFNFDSFCKKINEKLNLEQYVILDLLVNWIETICQIRKKEVMKFFLDIFPSILKMQSSSKSADNCLKIIKKNIEDNFTRYYKYNKELMEEIIIIIAKEASPKGDNINIAAWDLLNLFLRKSEEHLMIYLAKKNKNNDFASTNSNSLKLESIDKGKIKNSMTFKGANSSISLSQKEKGSTLINDQNNYLNIHNNSEQDKKNNKKHLIFNNINNGPSFEFKNFNSRQTYQGELISEGLFLKDDDILEYIPFKLFSKLLVLITQTYSFNIERQELIDRLNDTIKDIVYKAPDNIRDYGFIVEDVTKALLIGLKNPLSKNKERLMEWCQVLYKKYHKEIFSDFNVFIKEYISSAPSDKNTIFLGMIDFLCNIEMDKELTVIIIKSISQKLMKEPELMNNASMVILIIEKISKHSSLDIVYEAFSDVLENNQNYAFISKMVNYLNQYLINVPNGSNFRKSLINKKDVEDSGKNKELFLKMYKIWSFNPIALIVFCVVTEHFQLTYNIILNLIKIQLDNEYYLHLGQLIQLLESNLYDYIRIRLLDPIKNIYLIKALYGILMILPQGQAYNILSNRMCNVEALLEIENGFDDIKEEEDNMEEINELIEIFLNNQKLIKEAEDNKNKKFK